MSNTSISNISSKIYTVDQQAVIIDRDLAEIYGVTTSALNQAVSRNMKRVPVQFSFILDREQLRNLKPQDVTSSLAHGGRRKLPRDFTEHGAFMAPAILRPKRKMGFHTE